MAAAHPVGVLLQKDSVLSPAALPATIRREGSPKWREHASLPPSGGSLPPNSGGKGRDELKVKSGVSHEVIVRDFVRVGVNKC